MSADRPRVRTRRAALAFAALLALVAACRDHSDVTPAPNKVKPAAPAIEDPPPDPTRPGQPSGASNPKAPYKKPGPATANMPLGVPPATDVTTSPDGKTQTVVEYYANGNGYVEFHQKQGPDGKWLRHGPIRAWHENGRMQQEGEYTEGKLSGHWRYWDDMDSLEREGDYDEGLREGDWKEFHPGEKPKSAGFFHVGLAEGPWKMWHDNGQLEAEGEFVNNKREGLWKYYLPTGELDVDHTGTYKDNHKVQ
jgi:antitoxin component YwqK of YwqJK toxin-antitoxin module